MGIWIVHDLVYNSLRLLNTLISELVDSAIYLPKEEINAENG